ncbi:6-hydroxymethylpterin diphosphokinase MptE-like protein [Candidatus Neptunochlamydia vexilliferae]|uniref:6-hydroxymethylpterin diphosphokinase MptE-like domain-containing protein n=1 Tax=Candidatus Neptunichlamydia vexilliferae TaxID=1651774 RepID=A0ABS0B0U0_9BACT|nr:6-hydroxymethylpterin diphosphokinase MptE-like protein [Candidatus Neptunochlamydia vexilliferae]MBF5060005.1 hypothetical protein [Candidatus Neptunochlamydia vexilliferae]
MVKAALLEERYPNLSFLLRVHPFKPCPLSDKSVDLPKQDLEAIYVYGLNETAYLSLKTWLLENPERELIFLEENLGALDAFLETEHAGEIINHPQVHLRFNLDNKRLTPFLEECAESFPFEKIAVLSSEKTSRFYRIRLKLHRLTTIQHALFLERYYYHHLVKNLVPNFRRMDTSFDGNGLKGQFKNVPAIICGAGPSLSNDITALRTLDDRALIIAGGSAITALSNHNIRPHFGIAIDPNEEEVARFENSRAFEMPLFYAPRVHPKIFDTFNGPHGYLSTGTGGPLEKWLEEKLGLGQTPLQQGFSIEALSVTTTAIELAATLGCSPIILLGVDLAFTEGKTYASGVIADPTAPQEKTLKRKDIYGKPVNTLIKWVMESSAIATFAKNTPHLQLINATSGGLGFTNIPNMPLAQCPLSPPTDLRSKVHEAIQTHPLQVSADEVSTHLDILRASLLEARGYIQIALDELERIKGEDRDPETGKVIFAQMELETLDAYTCFLEGAAQSFIPLLMRKFRTSTENKWAFLFSKWKAYESLVGTLVSCLT